jgi:hypothetical protein
MKKKQQKKASTVVLIRTGEILPEAGTWRSECAREGCRAIMEMNFHRGAAAPCCPRCLNPTSLRHLFPAVKPIEPPRETAQCEAMAKSIEAPIVEPSTAIEDLKGASSPSMPAGEPPAGSEEELSLFEQLSRKTERRKV